MYITQLLYEGEEVSVILDENRKETFESFPCEWFVKKIDGKLFVMATASSKGKTHSIFLHQLVLGCEKEEKIVFYNQNTLDNRLCNLRYKKHLSRRVVKG